MILNHDDECMDVLCMYVLVQESKLLQGRSSDGVSKLLYRCTRSLSTKLPSMEKEGVDK